MLLNLAIILCSTILHKCNVEYYLYMNIYELAITFVHGEYRLQRKYEKLGTL